MADDTGFDRGWLQKKHLFFIAQRHFLYQKFGMLTKEVPTTWCEKIIVNNRSLVNFFAAAEKMLFLAAWK